MSETVESELSLPPAEERAMLMQRARLMGLSISNNIGLETLRARIRDKLEGTTTYEDALNPETNAESDSVDGSVSAVDRAGKHEPNPLMGETANTPPPKPRTLQQIMQEEQLKLIRLRITNLDPKKRDLKGEIITVANEYMGTVRKFVPFGEVTENGYHVPYCIYQILKEREFLNIRTTTGGRNGQIHVEQVWAKEFALDILPPLTKDELKRLATQQAAAAGM